MMRRSLAAAFADVDVIAWPSVPAVAPPLEEPLVELPSGTVTADAVNPRGGGLANLIGIPAVSVPVGFDDGLPIGLQLQGAWGSDALLLDAAEAIERATERRFVDALSPVAGGAARPLCYPCPPWPRSRSRTCRGSSAAASVPSTASTSRSPRARSTASSAPTAPARRPRCGC